jgi:hypothetical protein
MGKKVKRVKNIWPFDAGQLLGSRSYHYKVTGRGKNTKVSKSSTRFKGYSIYKDENGNYTVPKLTGNDGSYFEDLREAKRYITANRQSNPGMKRTVVYITNPIF